MFKCLRKHKVFGLVSVVFLASAVVVFGGELARTIVGVVDPAAEKSCFTKDMAFAEDSPLTKEEQTVFSQNNIVFYEPCTASSDTTLSGDIKISGTTAEEKVWSGLTSFMSKEQAAGVMGNMVGESGLGPTRHQGSGNGFTGSIWDNGSGKGLGLIQWDGGRRPKMANYVKQRDMSLINYLEDGSNYGGLSGDQLIEKVGHEIANKLYQAEIEFLKQELDKSYKELYDQQSVDDATNYFAKHVERCADCVDPAKINGDNMTNRRKKANEIYNRQSGKGSYVSNGVTSSISGVANSDVTSSVHDKAWELADQPGGGQGPTDAYLKAQQEVKCPDDCVNHGQSCDRYVGVTLRASGVDSEAPLEGHVGNFEDHILAHPEIYTPVEGDPWDESTYQPGDIRVRLDKNKGPNYRGHIEIYGQREGKGYILSASNGDRWAGYQTFFAADKSKHDYHIYRTQSTPKCITNDGGCAQNSMDVVGTAICLAHPLGTKNSVRSFDGGAPTDNFKTAIDAVFPLDKGRKKWNARSKAGSSCDVGAATVVRYSGVDKKFGRGLDEQHKVKTNDKWELIKPASRSDLQPGDLAYWQHGNSGHVWIYLGKIGKKLYGAHAHYNGRQYLGIEDSTNEAVDWILRPKNAQNTTQITMEMLKNAGKNSVVNESSSSGSSSSVKIGDAQGKKDINAAAIELAWPADASKSSSNYPGGDWNEAGKKAASEFVKETGAHLSDRGADCGDFANVVLWYAGIIKDKEDMGGPASLYKYMKKDTANWEEVEIKSKSDLQPGDIGIRFNSLDLCAPYKGGCHQHIAFYVEQNGEAYTSQASHGGFFGRLSKGVSDIFTKDHVMRYKGGASTDDNCDRCGNGEGDDANGTGLKEGGMTLEEARAWMEAYKKEASKKIPGGFQADHVFQGAFINYTTSRIHCKDGAMNNCVGFSQWFLNRYTSIKGAPNWKSTAPGNGMVSRLSDFGLKTGNEPRPYAIFSEHPANHTGVVMGVKGDNVIICEAGCGPGYVKGSPDTEWPGCRSWSKATTKSKGMDYAYTDNILKGVGSGQGGGGGDSF